MKKIFFFLKTVNYKLLLISLYKFTNTAILAFIAYFLFQIYEKLPKTYTINELKEIAQEDREKEDKNRYYNQIKIYPNYTLGGKIDADIDEPIKVEIDNEPVRVEIDR